MKKILFTMIAGVGSMATLQAATISSVEMFGSGGSATSIDFVEVGNAGNAADTDADADRTGRGSVASTYRIGTYEISRGQIAAYNADASNAANLITLQDMSSSGGNGAARPATGVSWNEAARFVNWLNTSQGHQAAYNFSGTGGNANITLWTTTDMGYDASNLFRNSLAEYWLPSVDEWYKAAYYNGDTGVYTNWATGATAPTATSGGTTTGTAVYSQPFSNGPADVTNAGGLSFYGTMAQSGNAWEWEETAYDSLNSSAVESRELRGGNWFNNSALISASIRVDLSPTLVFDSVGFRVAGSVPTEQVPEPSALLLSVIGGFGLVMRRKRG